MSQDSLLCGSSVILNGGGVWALGLPGTPPHPVQALEKRSRNFFFHLISGARRESTACAVLEWEVSGHRLGWQGVPGEQFTYYIMGPRALLILNPQLGTLI